MFLISFSFMLSFFFILISHPLSMGLILLSQTILICLMCGNMNINFWYSYILFLIMIGAMLILFIYMTSLASNEKFTFKNKFFLLIPVFLITLIINFSPLIMKTLNNEMLKLSQNNYITYSMEKYFNLPLNLIFSFFIIYLFLTLIAIVKITNFKMGPIRQLN